MKRFTLIDILLAAAFINVLVVLGGCASISYTAEAGKEILEVKTLFKSLDGLWAERNGEDFGIIIDKTHTHDPMRGISELLSTVDELRAMGLSYDPPAEAPE